MAQLKSIKWEGYWQKVCDYAEYGRVCTIMTHYAILEQLQRVHWYMSLLRRDDRTRRFHFSVITFHMVIYRFQALRLGP